MVHVAHRGGHNPTVGEQNPAAISKRPLLKQGKPQEATNHNRGVDNNIQLLDELIAKEHNASVGLAEKSPLDNAFGDIQQDILFEDIDNELKVPPGFIADTTLLANQANQATVNNPTTADDIINNVNDIDDGDGRLTFGELSKAKNSGNVSSTLRNLLNNLLELTKHSSEGVKISEGLDLNNPTTSQKSQAAVSNQLLSSGLASQFIAANRLTLNG